MNNKSESNFLIPILSAISGLGAILAAVSPLVFQNFIFRFIDSRLTMFASIVAAVEVVIALWLTSSVSSYSMFDKNNNQFPNQSKLNFNLLVGFLSSCSVFYLMRILNDSHVLNIYVCSFLQLISYFVSFLLLPMTVGFLFRDSYQGFKNDQLESTKIDKIKETLIKSGFIKIDLVINGIEEYKPEQFRLDRLGSKVIYARVAKKNYVFVVSREFNQLQESHEVPRSKQPS